MAHLTFDNVSIDFPIYSASARSLKKRLVQAATRGRLGADNHGRLIVRALEGLNFSIKDGDRVGLIGNNGAGKSTLLRLLSGVYEPSYGRASIKGKIGSLIDITLGTDLESTGRENIFFQAALLGISRSQVRHKIDDIIEFSELNDFIDMPFHTYSTGMRLRLTFSVATLISPEVLLMDEWLSVGDEGFRIKAEQRMKEILQAASILVLASHSRELIQNTCNRVIWLENGKIKMDGPTEEVLGVYFGAPLLEPELIA